jgi:hypothetical protein
MDALSSIHQQYKKCEKKVSCRFPMGELFLLGNLSRKNFKLFLFLLKTTRQRTYHS